MRWDLQFLNLAHCVRNFSKDPSTKVGAVISDQDNRVVSIGYNGFPKYIKDDDRLHDRDLKLKIIVHAEANAILFANKPLNGCTIYTMPFMPCSNCASLIIQSGIKRVVSIENNNPKWCESFDLARELFKECNIELKIYTVEEWFYFSSMEHNRN